MFESYGGRLERLEDPMLPRLWFERGCPERLRPLLAGRAVPVGPGEDELSGAQAVLAGKRVWDRDAIGSMPQLRVIARTGIGVDSVDLVAATDHGVLVCNTPDGPTVSTAEHTIMLLLSAAKCLKALNPILNPEDTPKDLVETTALELNHRCLGLIGYGRIGRRVASLALAMGMEVVAHDPFAGQTDIELLPIDEFWPRCDAISVHAPLTEDTRGMIDAKAFSKMKPGVIFINTARGGLVDHAALTSALDDGVVRSAGLDVTDPEPLPFEHPLLGRQNVIITPHVASATTVGRERMLVSAIEQALTALEGRRPKHLVNTEVLEFPS